MNKRGQVSFYLIIGIVLLIFLYLVLQSLAANIAPPADTPTGKLRLFIETCIKDTATYALYRIGMQAGYHHLPSDIFTTQFLSIPYTVNSAEGIEQDLGQFMAEHLQLCINTGLYRYKPLFQSIQLSEPRATVKLQSKSVSFAVEYPVIVQTIDSTTSLEQPYTLSLPIRLKHLQQVAEGILQEQHNMKLACRDPDISITGTYAGDANIFLLQDKASLLTNSPDMEQEYKFLFAKFTG